MLSHQRSTTVSLETYPLYWFIWAYCCLFVFIMLLTKCNNTTTKILLVPWLGHNHPEPQVAVLIEADWECNLFFWIFSVSYIVTKNPHECPPLFRSVGNAYCQSRRGFWDTCWSFGLHYWVRGWLLCMCEIGRSTTTARTRYQPWNRNRRTWMSFGWSVWYREWNNIIQWKHRGYRNH